MVAVLVWDGFLLIGEGFGLTGRASRRFADVAWLTTAGLLLTWTATLAVTLW